MLPGVQSALSETAIRPGDHPFLTHDAGVIGDPLRHRFRMLHHSGSMGDHAGTIRQRTQTTHAQRKILAALDIDEPPEFFDITPSA